MKIIGHRGAAGLALENSSASIKKAVELGVDVIEIDVRLTDDDVLVVNHDASLGRTSPDKRLIRDYTWDELKDVKLKDGSSLLRLEDALELANNTMLLIELKDEGSIKSLLKVLNAHPKAAVEICSFKLQQLAKLKKQQPKLSCMALAFSHPSRAIEFSKAHGLDGVGVPVWCWWPTVYRRVTKAGLSCYTYTVNNDFWGHFIMRFWPNVDICTNHPERFIV